MNKNKKKTKTKIIISSVCTLNGSVTKRELELRGEVCYYYLYEENKDRYLEKYERELPYP